MNYKICLYVKDIKSINRTIVVNDNLSLQLFIKSLIVSMNGNSNNLYNLFHNEEIVEYEDDANLTFLNLKEGDIYCVEYNYNENFWDLEFEVFEKNVGLKNKEFEIIDLSGYGICLQENMFFIKELIDTNNKKWKNDCLSHYKFLNKYFNSEISLEEINEKVNDYILFYKDMYSPKNIVMNISLEGFNKEIKRKIIVNNNILIDKFCRAVVVSMNGDLDHLYTIKINKKFYEENILDKKLNFLDLSVGSKFKVVYDYGDNWQFNIRISKIENGYNEKEFIIVKGTGYGIVEDCGGIYGLYNVFTGKSDYFEAQDINEFNLDEIQKWVDEELKIDNLH